VPTQIETDSSGYAVGAVFNQEHSDGWNAVAYRTKLPDSRTRTSRPYLCFEEVEIILVWNGVNTILLLLRKPIGNSLERNLVGSSSSVSFLPSERVR